jgi:hypothetical protein
VFVLCFTKDSDRNPMCCALCLSRKTGEAEDCVCALFQTPKRMRSCFVCSTFQKSHEKEPCVVRSSSPRLRETDAMCCVLFFCFQKLTNNQFDVLCALLFQNCPSTQDICCVLSVQNMFLESLRVALSCSSTKTLCVVLSCHSTKTLSVIPCVMLSPLPKPLMQSARGCALLFKNYPRKSLGVCCAHLPNK